jgi:hypothetical protein
MTVGQSARKVRNLLDSLPDAMAGLEKDLAGRRMVVPVFASNPDLVSMKPDIEAALFGKDRFGGTHEERGPDGKPTGRKYQVTGLGELMYDTGSKLLSAQLQAQVLDEKGQPTGETLLVPATKPGKDGARTNADDAVVSQSSLDEMKTFLDGKINGSILLMKGRDQAAQQALLKHSRTAREGVSKVIAGQFENKAAWQSAEGSEELQKLYNDPLLGAAFKNVVSVTRAFGGSPKDALLKAHSVIEKAQTLATDKQEAQDFVSTFTGILEAAGNAPENPWSGITSFFNSNPVVIGKKGTLDAIKQAQTVISSNQKTKREDERDRQQWARIELLAQKAGGNGGGDSKPVNQEKRDVAARIREAQRAYQSALKTTDPDMINEPIKSS